jgi:hypothetical protein
MKRSTTHMSRVTTKPTQWVCDQHGSRPACASAQSDQDPWCSLTNSFTNTETDSEQHGSMHYVVFVMTRLIYRNNYMKFSKYELCHCSDKSDIVHIISWRWNLEFVNMKTLSSENKFTKWSLSRYFVKLK